MVGSRYAGIVDSQATIAEGDHCVLYVWYDNEFGYSCQVVRVMEQMAGAVRQDHASGGARAVRLAVFRGRARGSRNKKTF